MICIKTIIISFQVKYNGAILKTALSEFSAQYVVMDQFKNISLNAIDDCLKVGRTLGYVDFDEASYVCPTQIYHYSTCYHETMYHEYEKYAKAH